MLNSRQRTMRAAFSLERSILNLQEKNLNFEVYSDTSLGRMRIFKYLSLCKG
jgi:hypothetical protein